MQKVVYILVFFTVIITGCSSAKRSGRTESNDVRLPAKPNSLEAVIRNNVSNNDFYIQRADINVVQENTSVRLSASIKYKTPDSLLVTIRSRTGIEAGRVFISKDTIIIVDRINKKLLVGTPSAIGGKYGIDPLMLFLILGDIILEDKDRTKLLDCEKGSYVKEFMVYGKNVEYQIDCKQGKLTKIYLEGDIKSGNITIGLSDIVNTGNLIYPRQIEIKDDLKSVGISIAIKKIESPWPGKIGFTSGQGYKVIKIR